MRLQTLFFGQAHRYRADSGQRIGIAFDGLGAS